MPQNEWTGVRLGSFLQNQAQSNRLVVELYQWWVEVEVEKQRLQKQTKGLSTK
ncbi:hypothetical protein Hanom_Chr05g00461341 [Helianthus anomalus]